MRLIISLRSSGLGGLVFFFSLFLPFCIFFFGSEAQPRRSAEDCIRLNCAVVFYTTVNGGILEKASGALGVNTLSKGGLTAGGRSKTAFQMT